MLIANILQWWYVSGWKIFVSKIFGKLRDIADFFSIGLLLKTLFAPFRQIAAGSVEGALEDRFRAAIDRLVSRCVGAVTRTFIILAGLVAMAATTVAGVASIVIWPLVPLMPVACIVLAAMGVTL